MSQAELAGLFEVRRATIRGWERAGCPVERKSAKIGEPSLYKPVDVIKWRQEQAVRAATGELAAADMNELRRRKLAAEVVLVELTLAEKDGRLIDLGIVEEQFTDVCMSLKGRFLALPATLVPRLVLASTQQEFYEIVQNAVYEALTEISSPDFLPLKDKGDDTAPLATERAGDGV